MVLPPMNGSEMTLIDIGVGLVFSPYRILQELMFSQNI